MSTTTEGKDDIGNGSMLSIDFLSLSLKFVWDYRQSLVWEEIGFVGRYQKEKHIQD